jgi:hypothetical protein
MYWERLPLIRGAGSGGIGNYQLGILVAEGGRASAAENTMNLGFFTVSRQCALPTLGHLPAVIDFRYAKMKKVR